MKQADLDGHTVCLQDPLPAHTSRTFSWVVSSVDSFDGMALSTTLYLWHRYRVSSQNGWLAERVAFGALRNGTLVSAGPTGPRFRWSRERLGSRAECGFFLPSLRLRICSFSGNWCLELGAYSRAHSRAVEPRPRSEGVGVGKSGRAGLTWDTRR